MTNEPRIPGSRLRRLAERTFDRETLERVLLPALADLQHECVRSASRLVYLRAYWGFWKAMAICKIADTCRHARPTFESVSKRMAIILPIVMGAAMVPALNIAFNGQHSPGWFLLTSSPQAFALALLVAYYFAVTLEQWPTSPRHLLPAISAMSVVCTLVMLSMTMSILPLATQAYRASVADRLRASGRIVQAETVTFGSGEWTFTDLIRHATSASSEADHDRARARQEFAKRLTTATMPIMLGFMGLGISGYTRKIALFSGVWVLILYFAALRAAASSSYHPPSIQGVWLVNMIFTLGGLWLVWLRPRPDDGEPRRQISVG